MNKTTKVSSRRIRLALAAALGGTVLAIPFDHGIASAADQNYQIFGCDTKVSGFEHYGLASASTRNESNPVECQWGVRARVTYTLLGTTGVATSGYEDDGYVRMSKDGVQYDWTRAQGAKQNSSWYGFYR